MFGTFRPLQLTWEALDISCSPINHRRLLKPLLILAPVCSCGLYVLLRRVTTVVGFIEIDSIALFYCNI